MVLMFKTFRGSFLCQSTQQVMFFSQSFPKDVSELRAIKWEMAMGRALEE